MHSKTSKKSARPARSTHCRCHHEPLLCLLIQLLAVLTLLIAMLLKLLAHGTLPEYAVEPRIGSCSVVVSS